MNATRVSDIPRRPIRIAIHIPITTAEHEAMYELGRRRASVQLYEEGPVQELETPALADVLDAQAVAGRVVMTVSWVGCVEPPAELMEVVGYRDPSRKRPATNYAGMGARPLGAVKP